MVGSEIGAYIGLKDDRDIILRADKAVKLVFSSTAKSTEVSRLGLKLHRLEFVETETVTGVLGDQEHGPTPLTTHGQALHKSQEHQHQRRQWAHHRVGGQTTDERRGGTHHHQGGDQR